jgi:hypothetical protein
VEKFNEARVNGGSNYDSLKVAKCLQHRGFALVLAYNYSCVSAETWVTFNPMFVLCRSVLAHNRWFRGKWNCFLRGTILFFLKTTFVLNRTKVNDERQGQLVDPGITAVLQPTGG